MMMLILLWISTFAYAQECYGELDQDLNCNGIDAIYEGPVDLSDPTCLAQLDSNGNPYPNQDYYFFYEAFGCLYPTANLDPDGDGLATGSIFILDANGEIYTVYSLSCDNCAEVYNPDQKDSDCDGFGDVCVARGLRCLASLASGWVVLCVLRFWVW